MRKRNEDLERLINTQFTIINTYKDEVDKQNKIIANLEKIIISLNEDAESMKQSLTLEVKKGE